MTWNESLGAMIMRWDVLVLNGTVVVCGAITNDNGRMRRHNKAVLNKLWVKVDGQKRLRNLSYFTVYPVGQDLIGVASNCKPLPGPVKSNSSIEMGADTIRVRD
ncbi:MAG: hypothetical protein QNJ09_02190 [Paracoccaceae bacterium]|nr:hypothetical protein [Paracoccaceae bacterium]